MTCRYCGVRFDPGGTSRDYCEALECLLKAIYAMRAARAEHPARELYEVPPRPDEWFRGRNHR